MRPGTGRRCRGRRAAQSGAARGARARSSSRPRPRPAQALPGRFHQRACGVMRHDTREAAFTIETGPFSIARARQQPPPSAPPGSSTVSAPSLPREGAGVRILRDKERSSCHDARAQDVPEHRECHLDRISSGASRRCLPDSPRKRTTICAIGKDSIVDNAGLAEQLDAFAALLDLAGSGHYTVRAYRRAADRSVPRRQTSQRSSAPGGSASSPASARDRPGCGSSSRRASWRSCGSSKRRRYRSSSASRACSGSRRSGSRTRARARDPHARGAARSGRRRKARQRAGDRAEDCGANRSRAPDLSTARPRRGMLLHRARALVGEIAEALGGAPAGDPRRACDLSTRFAVVVPSNSLYLAGGAAADRGGAGARRSAAAPPRPTTVTWHDDGEAGGKVAARRVCIIRCSCA